MEDLGELFVAVQQQKIFHDQKTFVDAVPLYPVAEIVAAYQKEKATAGFDLLLFLNTYFRIPAQPVQPPAPLSYTIDEHIERLWDLLTRKEKDEGTLIALPYPSIVPGGRFREVFYWDTYFSMLGLQVAGRIDLIENMVNNFSYLIDAFGFIPNGNRTYFLSRSQPPFFSYMIEMLAEEKTDKVFTHYLPQLRAEYDFWMSGAEALSQAAAVNRRVVRMPDGSILNRYWDEMTTTRPEGYLSDIKIQQQSAAPAADTFRHIRGACESGWDFSGRWFTDQKNIGTIHTCDLVPVDLNCLMWHLEKTLAKAYRLKGDNTTADSFVQKAKDRVAAIEKFCWQQEAQCYGDYDFVLQQSSPAVTIAMAFPLFAGIAAPDRASGVLDRIGKDFLQPGGLLTTLVQTGQQWDAPNGWAPLQWIGYKAAVNYRHAALAATIAHNWMLNVERVFASAGKMMEKYNVVDTSLPAGGGEYTNQDGFGWTNGVYARFKQLEQ